MGGALLLIPIHAIMARRDNSEFLLDDTNDHCPTRRQSIATWHAMHVCVTKLPTYMAHLLVVSAVNKSQPPARQHCTWKELGNLREKIKDLYLPYLNSTY
jgi:hypothetical protein